MATILIAEDEPEIRQIQKDYLKQESHQVIEASTGYEAIEQFDTNPAIDCIILDLNLPELDGIQVCRRLRAKTDIPIIMVTARTGEIDELLGLEVGADDYLKKPFSPKVLVARVKALLKRPHTQTSKDRLTFKDITLDTKRHTIIKNNQPLELTATQYQLLKTLLTHPGRTFTREELIEHAYPQSMPPDIFDRTIDTHIKNLRKTLRDDPKNPQYIKTVRGIGYRLNDD